MNQQTDGGQRNSVCHKSDQTVGLGSISMASWAIDRGSDLSLARPRGSTLQLSEDLKESLRDAAVMIPTDNTPTSQHLKSLMRQSSACVCKEACRPGSWEDPT